jgi:hypothetical protein
MTGGALPIISAIPVLAELARAAVSTVLTAHGGIHAELR